MRKKSAIMFAIKLMSLKIIAKVSVSGQFNCERDEQFLEHLLLLLILKYKYLGLNLQPKSKPL
jgi:hypothetical protein